MISLIRGIHSSKKEITFLTFRFITKESSMKASTILLSLILSSSVLANGVGTPHSDVAGPETTDIMGYGTPGGGGVENELRMQKEEQLKQRNQKMQAEEDRVEEIKEMESEEKRKK